MPQIVFSSNTSPLPLLKNEQTIFSVRPHFLITLSFIILTLIAGAGSLFLLWISKIGSYTEFLLPSWLLFTLLIIVFLSTSLIIFLYWSKTKYLLTSERVQIETGIIAKKVIGIPLNNIQNLKLETSFWGRIFSFGTIVIEPAGLETKIVFANIAEPRKRLKEIATAKTQQKNL